MTESSHGRHGNFSLHVGAPFKWVPTIYGSTISESEDDYHRFLPVAWVRDFSMDPLGARLQCGPVLLSRDLRGRSLKRDGNSKIPSVQVLVAFGTVSRSLLPEFTGSRRGPGPPPQTGVQRRHLTGSPLLARGVEPL